MTYSYSTRSMFEGAPKRVASLLTLNLDDLVYFSDNKTKLVSKIKNKNGKKRCQELSTSTSTSTTGGQSTGSLSMIGENRQLIINEPFEFEK